MPNPSACRRVRKALSLLVMFTVPVTATIAAQSKPVTKEQAAALLRQREYPATPQGLLGVLETAVPDLVEIVRAYIAAGVPVDRPVAIGGAGAVAPLNHLLAHECSGEQTVAVVNLLLDAGASPSLRNPTRNGMTPAMEAVRCPLVLGAILARKPDLTLVNNSGASLLEIGISLGEPRDLVVRMILEAGFDPKPKQKELLAIAGRDPALLAILTGALAGIPSAPAPRTAVDWKAVGPFPARSAAEAAKMLSRPGATTTIDEHFNDGIGSREPLRVALALQAGADVRQRFATTGYTPLLLLADRCDQRDVAQQVAVADMLVAARADPTGVDANKSNALVVGARHCPVGVIRAFIAAGVSLTDASALGETPLRAAIRSGRAEVVDALLTAGVDPKKEPYNVNREVSGFGNKEIEATLKRHRK